MALTPIKISLLLAFLMTSLPALGDDTKATEKTRAKKSNPCINLRERLNYVPMSDEFVFVESRARKYLLSMKNRCPGLRRGYYMHFRGDNRRICSSHRAKLEYVDREIQMPACQVQRIEEVENWNEASAIVAEFRQEQQALEEKRRQEKENRKKR
jgi:hypothetical protein